MKGDYTKPSDVKSRLNTMKTDKNSQTATQSGTPAHPEQTFPDNNSKKRYEVELHLTQYKYARIIVEADSLEDAEEKAEAEAYEANKWEIADQDQYVYGVNPIEGGSHE